MEQDLYVMERASSGHIANGKPFARHGTKWEHWSPAVIRQGTGRRKAGGLDIWRDLDKTMGHAEVKQT